MVDVTIDLAQQFHAMLTAADDFEPLHEPQCNIVAFRYLPPELRDVAAGESRRVATAAASRRDRIGRVLPGAKPHRRPSGPADDDDEPADDGRRPATDCSNACAASDASLSRPATDASSPAACGLAVPALPHAKIIRFRAVLVLIHLLPQVGKLCGRLAAIWFLRLGHFAVFPRFERL